MATKWNVFKNKINKRSVLSWSSIIALLCALFFFGMVISDSLKGDYERFLVLLFFTALLVFVAAGLTFWYLSVAEKYVQEDYVILRERIHGIWKWQIKIITIYLIAAFVIMLLPYDYTCLLEELYVYGMGWIIAMILVIIPAFTLSTARINYCWRINDTQEGLYQLDCLCSRMENGDLEIENPFSEGSYFFRFGEAFTNISHITKAAVEKQVKSEKMKVDLISNISHDLKTPLTSISTYIDLMKKETLSDEMQDYLEVLSSRTGKLTEMIESLFELSKTSSGNMDLCFEQMEMNRLAEQTLADMRDSVSGNGKILKLNLTDQNTGFTADSKAMYRVCQNLFENAFKYSLNGTRIFIRTTTGNGRITLVVINTANYEMNFTNDDIVERFTRGDEARTTDGNGLGLAIAKTYAEACGGEFHVEVTGDQFLAELSFPHTEAVAD